MTAPSNHRQPRALTRRAVLGGAGALAVAATLAACSKSSSGSDGDGGVYFLNFKPESEQAFKDIAAAYTKKSGVAVKVVTAGAAAWRRVSVFSTSVAYGSESPATPRLLST